VSDPTTYARGIRPADAHWRAMRDVWQACRTARIPIPEAVLRFFDDEDPDEAGVVIELPEAAVREWSDGDMRNGLEVVLDALPEGVKVVRFVMSS
jgi:hypothetical protein